jgi:hypothetical protein
MKAIIFEKGQKVRCTPGCGERSGTLGVVVGDLAMRDGFGDDGKTVLKSYRVQWSDDVITPATQIALEPAPPSRKDSNGTSIDTVVGWCWFDPDVERAIKEGPVKDY